MSTAPGAFTAIERTTGKTIKLAMQRLWLTGQILPVGARLQVRHEFSSAEDKPLEVIYSFMLPRDAALRRFRISGEGFEAHSELKQTEEAVKAYEAGLAEGMLSTLARQYGDGIVNLTVGNIRPGETVRVDLEILAGVEARDDGFRFRFPFTLSPAYHPRARAFGRDGVGETELPADEFGDVILPPLHRDARNLHQVGFELSMLGQVDLDEIGSPSHAVRARRRTSPHNGTAHVTLATQAAVPDRDLVLDAHWTAQSAQVFAGRGKDERDHFAALIPSSNFGVNPETPRRVVILLDRSGSMRGDPLAQACKAIEACLGALSESNAFGLVAFDNRTETFRSSIVPATRDNRDSARKFLGGINAGGGTELANGFIEAVKLLNQGPGDVLILTDGQVSGTEDILGKARETGTRLHCLGIGSASQDRFLALLARETGGVSRFVTPSERVDLAAVDLFASLGRPVATGVKCSPPAEPEAPGAVFSGTPLLLFGRVEGPGVDVSWDAGALHLPISVEDGATGESVRLLRGSRLITDWESRYPSAVALAPLEKRKSDRVAARIKAISDEYGLASREMSLVAVVKRTGDQPGQLPETRVVPVGMPKGVAFGAYFGSMDNLMLASAPPQPGALVFDEIRLQRPLLSTAARFQRALSRRKQSSAPGTTGVLLELASQLEPDGGMPGKSEDERAMATVLAVLAFLSQGHTLATGTFRSHVGRLVAYLNAAANSVGKRKHVIAAVLELARHGSAPAGDWVTLARKTGNHWKEIERAVHTAA